MYYFSYDERHDKESISTMHDGETESQDITELCDVYLVGSELCGVCCVLWCVRVRVPGPRSGTRELGSNACHIH
jgi:hypothetical protein